MIPFPIVDAHVHLYDTNRLRYPWLSMAPKIAKPHLPADFDRLRGGAEVDKIVFVEVAVDDAQQRDEAAFVSELAAADPRIQGMVAAAPLENGAAVEADLEKLCEHKILRGVRRLIEAQPDIDFCVQPKFIEGVRLLSKFGLAFDICIKHFHMRNAVALARQCPDTPMALDHIGKPGVAHDLIEPWWSQIKALAELPHVCCKISGVLSEANHETWTQAQIVPYVTRVIDVFGFDRVMFGSDWPVSEHTHRYADWVDIVDRITAGCSDDERLKLFRDNAIRFYRLD